MLNAYFNPYTSVTTDFESGKRSLLATAKTWKNISDEIKIVANQFEGVDSIKGFVLTEDNSGSRYAPADLLTSFPKRDRELVIRFVLFFAKGTEIKSEELSVCDDWILSGLGTPAPILEYALRQDGISVTISDDIFWKSDFYHFAESVDGLPNIHGQEDWSSLREWAQQWLQRNLSFKSFLEQHFNMLFCPGVENFCFPSHDEQQGFVEALTNAQKSHYNVDNDLIKPFRSKFGSILELRSYRAGARMFFILKEGRPILGGFYRKSAARDQQKAGNYAAKRLRDNKYL